MGKRGRPPHQNVLTPREWEVLALLRERLSNEQIAERLGITLDGAKYHVSEILSKLGAKTRGEAALWQPAEPRRWWRGLIALPTAAKIAGTLTIIAAAGGLGALALGVVATESREERLISAGHVGEYAVGDPVHFGKGFWLTKIDATLVLALSDVDPHAGSRSESCRIEWRPDVTLAGESGWFRGKCSGSNFGLDGHLASGPSPRGMDRYSVQSFGISNGVPTDEITVDVGTLRCGPGEITAEDDCAPARPNQLPPPPAPPVLSADVAILRAMGSLGPTLARVR